MKNFNTKSIIVFTAFALLFTSGSLMAQLVGKPSGNALNFFNTNAFGGQLGHQQAGSFGSLGGGDQWIGIGQPAIPTPVYGTRIQWDGSLATMVLQDGGASKNLEIQWGGQGSTADMDFKFVFDPFNPAGERQIMRLTDLGRVGIGTTSPFAKLDVRTQSTDGNFYGIFSRNDRTSGAGGYFDGNTYGSYSQASSNQTNKYGALNVGSGNNNGYGTYGIGKIDEGNSYGVYGEAIICEGTGYGIYGTTDPCANAGVIDYAGYFDGDVVITGTLTVLSDRRLKKNIKNESSSLAKIMQLRPTTYEYNQEKFDFMNMAEGLNHGFIAQELEEVFPEMVTNNSHPVTAKTTFDEEGNPVFSDEKTENLAYKGVNYQMMIPVLTKAIQEQQEQIEALTEALENAQQGSSKGALDAGSMNQMETNVLFQNVPNPFDAETEIRYSTVKSARNVMLNIYDLQGRQISSFENLSVGEGKVNISGATLDAGMYIYSLIVDGEEAGTKRMIITKN